MGPVVFSALICLAVLCYAYYAVLCYDVLWTVRYGWLCYMQCYVLLQKARVRYAILHSAVLCCAVLC